MLLEICEPCIEVADIALDLMNIGYTAVRGDTSGAVSGGLGGADTAIATAYLNLQSFRDEREAGVLRRRFDALRDRAQTLRAELNSKVTGLRAEGLPSSAIEPESEGRAPESLPLAAKQGGAKYKERAQIRQPVAAVKEAVNEQGIAQSDKEIFDEIFVGRKRGAWFKRLQDFFTLQGLGFAANKGFLQYVKQGIAENKYRSAGKLTDEVLLKWYKAFDARQRREGL
jgi:hypothetical protein